jgi:hypothetical protein
MSATILPFRDHHFTVVDTERLDGLAAAMITIGAWERVNHIASDRNCDWGFEAMLVYVPGDVDRSYSIERHRNGAYWLIDCETMCPLVSARTLTPVLSPFNIIDDDWLTSQRS